MYLCWILPILHQVCQPPYRARVDCVFASAAPADGPAHREPIRFASVEPKDLRSPQRSGQSDSDPGLSAGLAETTDFGRSEPIEERRAVFTPGVEKQDRTSVATSEYTNLLGERGFRPPPVGVGHDDRLADVVCLSQRDDRLGPFAWPACPAAATGKTPLQIGEPYGRGTVLVSAAFGQFTHGGTHGPPSGNRPDDRRDHFIRRSPEGTSGWLFYVNERGAAGQCGPGFFWRAHTHKEFGHK
jgi:hypothetical protein